ncbi:MAG TPA: hypothetical protein PKA41_00140 [Verrucomicrobiota bacterium]|nr:hypothetical protein [Verrucomicrobiota bacterium]
MKELFIGIEPKNTKECVSRILATTAGFIALAYLFNAPIRVDKYFLIFYAMAFLPWIGYFIKRAGKDNIEFSDPTSEKVSKETLVQIPKVQEAVKFESLSPEAKRILKTLDYYQRQGFKKLDAEGRWAFTIPFGHPNHAQFMGGILELHSSGLISMDHGTGRFGLSDDGVKLLSENQNDIGKISGRYVFDN